MQQTGPARPELGDFLRFWRQQLRGKSQLDLSLDAGVSQRQLLLTLSQALDVPFRERNVLPVASGYAPLYVQND